MIRRPPKWLVNALAVGFVAGVLALGLATLATQYLFQEPAYVTWSRFLKPELQWQRQKYPSITWAFDFLETIIVHLDPRERFTLTGNGPSQAELSSWTNAIVGPGADSAGFPDPMSADALLVTNEDELQHAISSAGPGTVIEIQPGTYDFSGRSIDIRNAGEPGRPVVLRGVEFGSVRFRFDLLEGFHVRAPYWTFENLVIEGVCKQDGYCEHAFHVVGAGRGTVIRKNLISDFNAPLKVNGLQGTFPDEGLVEFNAFVNNRPRDTGNPVTLLDIVAVSDWRVRKNFLADFAKAGSDYISYGAFFKGGGEGNIFEQNLVRCEWRHAGGARIGFSFGGGGTSRTACRNDDCNVEHRNGTARNNIIMNCPNDVGIYLNRSAQTRIHNNTLVNTRGIDVRFPPTTGVIANNIIDGRILAREDGTYTATNNILEPLEAAFLGNVSAEIYANPGTGDFRLNNLGSVSGRGVPIDDPGTDLCGQSYHPEAPDIGPIQYGLGLDCTPILR